MGRGVDEPIAEAEGIEHLHASARHGTCVLSAVKGYEAEGAEHTVASAAAGSSQQVPRPRRGRRGAAALMAALAAAMEAVEAVAAAVVTAVVEVAATLRVEPAPIASRRVHRLSSSLRLPLTPAASRALPFIVRARLMLGGRVRGAARGELSSTTSSSASPSGSPSPSKTTSRSTCAFESSQKQQIARKAEAARSS